MIDWNNFTPWTSPAGGFFPRPALASLVSSGAKPLIFTAAMIAGMAIFELPERRTSIKNNQTETSNEP